MEEKQMLENLLLWIEMTRVHKEKLVFNEANAYKNILIGAKHFLVEKDVMRLLDPNYTNNQIGIRKLPFTRILILNTFKLDKYIIRGFGITKTIWEDDLKEGIKCYFFVDYGNRTVRGYTGDIEGIKGVRPYNSNPKDESMRWNKEDEKLIDLGRLFMCNFIDFLNNPEVELVRIDRTEKQNVKRINKGKLPIHSYDYVKVTGKLKIYLNELQSGGHFNYSHRFWVRGHFRTLRNGRYKDKVGTKIWIVPYIKGQGILVNKIYDVGKTKVEA